MRRRKKSSTAYNERSQLECFLFRADQLQNTRLIQSGFKPSFSMSYDRMKGVQFSSKTPDDDDLRSFLTILRQFISQEETIHLFKIYNLCQQRLSNDNLKHNLMKAREIWQRELKRGGISLIFNGRSVTPERITYLCINVFYFHNDSEKMDALRRLKPHENMLVKHIFLDHLVEATRNVLYVAFIIKVAFREGFFQGL